MPTQPADLFAMAFNYTSSNTSLNAAAQYNGNISSIEWKVKGREKATYGFQYDDLNRLTNAKFSNINSSGGYFLDNNNDFTVSGITYDKVGNILTLDRKGMTAFNGTTPSFGDIDLLSYTYNGNQLQAVADAANNTNGFKNGTISKIEEYGYDDNGNMTSDENKELAITYNHLNLPTRITYLPNSKYIDITYDAAGVKLMKEVYENGTLSYTKDYVGGIEYNDNVLEAIYHAEGRITPIQGNDFIYEYSLKDHLGNSRVTFADIDGDGTIDETTEILQENHYYPFGMQMEGLQTPQVGVENKYGYNGKEMNDDFGLGWLDYGARWYDASIARWSAVDPLAEEFYGYSSYNYAGNNPIFFIDVDGKFQFPAGKQKEYEEKYPRLTAYLKSGDLSRLSKNKKIANALNKYTKGQLTTTDIEKDIKYGEGPILEIIQLDGRCGTECNGSYGYSNDGKDATNLISLDSDMINALETALFNDIEADLLNVVSTIFHEYTHYGDRDDDYYELDEKTGRTIDEEGVALEEAVWGVNLDADNASHQLKVLKGEFDGEGFKGKDLSVIPKIPKLLIPVTPGNNFPIFWEKNEK